MDWIYPVSYLASLGGLILWFFVQENKALSRKMSAVFLTGFLIYLFSLAFSSGTTGYKLMILVRDMVVMGIVSQLFNVFQRNKFVSIGMGAVAVLVVFFSYFKTLDLTFPQFPKEAMDASAEFLIEVDEAHVDVLDKIRSQFPCEITQAFHPIGNDAGELINYYTVDLKTDNRRKIREFYDRYATSGSVEWLEPNELIELESPSNAATISGTKRHYSNDPEIGKQWAFDILETDALHKSLAESGITPRQTARVVILDTGVESTHEDLAASFRSIDANSDSDPNGHGTHCAGIVGAVSNNGVGIASLAPSTGFVEISAVRVLNASGMGTQKSILDGLIKAVDSGADVISVSLGGYSSQSKQKAYRDVIRYADKHNVIVVVAAGNNNTNSKQYTPANVDGVITVAAVDEANQKAAFSNTVQNLRMGIAAPGVNIYSTLPNNTYGPKSGTSMATPQVSGLVALMRSLRPSLTTTEVYDILSSTGIETKSGKQTGKLIQPLKALEAVLD